MLQMSSFFDEPIHHPIEPEREIIPIVHKQQQQHERKGDLMSVGGFPMFVHFIPSKLVESSEMISASDEIIIRHEVIGPELEKHKLLVETQNDPNKNKGTSSANKKATFVNAESSTKAARLESEPKTESINKDIESDGNSSQLSEDDELTPNNNKDSSETNGKPTTFANTSDESDDNEAETEPLKIAFNKEKNDEADDELVEQLIESIALAGNDLVFASDEPEVQLAETQISTEKIAEATTEAAVKVTVRPYVDPLNGLSGGLLVKMKNVFSYMSDMLSG